MPTKRILVVDDEQDIRELLRYNLSKEGYQVECVASGEETLSRARNRPPDLLVLDLMLPGVDGLEVCKRLKSEPRTASILIIMLTAKGEDADVVTGLELGAEDYVIKPFSPRVLLARVRAVLRRKEDTSEETSTILERGAVTIDLGRHQVTANGQPVSLTALELRILLALARRPGMVLTRYQIVMASQGAAVGVTDRSVDVHILSLRRKLGASGHLIETVRGVGYRLMEIES